MLDQIQQASRRSRTIRRSRPILEWLEDRRLPSTVVVNTANDSTDKVGSSIVSLRDAIAMANASTVPVSITFDPKVFATEQTIKIAGSRLIIQNTLAPITITGPSAGVVINGSNSVGDFVVWTATNATLTGLTITNGNSGNGGGVDCYGTVTLDQDTISGNTAPNGGGIFNNGVAILDDDTISGNKGTTGGGIWNTGGGYVTLTDVTIAGNSSSYGGGICTDVGAVEVHSSTIVGNVASYGGGGLYNAPGGTLGVVNSIIAGNSLGTGATAVGPDVDGAAGSPGYNLVGNTSGGTGWVGTDETGTATKPLAAGLSVLGYYGGPTETMVPLSGSPAIAHGSTALSYYITTDQRGLARQQNGTVDIGAVEAQPLVVNTTSDLTSGASAFGTLSLREAIAVADVEPTSSAITFSTSVFAARQTILLDGSRLIIQNSKGSITITGPSAGVIINGNNASGDFVVQSATTATLIGLTITGGNSGNGAGVDSYGNVTLKQDTISGNTAPNGGGIFSLGLAILIGDTISGNTGVTGGGIWNFNGASMTLTNVTIANNSATYGGGIYNGGTGTGAATTELRDVTIADNKASSTGGGVYNGSGNTVGLANTIIAADSLPANSYSGIDASGAFMSLGYNLIGSTYGSTGWLGTDLTGTGSLPLSPMLGPLAFNGGPTETLLPLAGSKAINHGSTGLVPAGTGTDQRGDLRIINGTVDIGAVEA